MSLLKPSLLFSLRRATAQGSIFARNASWNQDWKPGPVPQTEAERRKAAEKYGLLPEEYDVIPDDGEGAGDYPNLPLDSVESRDPFYPWAFPEYRRNFGEAMHRDANFYTEDRYDACMKPRYSLPVMLAGFLTIFGVNTLLWYTTDFLCFLPASPRAMPAEGKHYKYN